MNLASCDVSEPPATDGIGACAARTAEVDRPEGAHSQLAFPAMLRELGGDREGATGVQEAPAERLPPGLDSNWSTSDCKAGTRTRDLEEWERCLREREADLRLREEANVRRRAERTRFAAGQRPASDTADEALAAASSMAPANQRSEQSRRFQIMSQLLSELRKSQIVALDEARGGPGGGPTPAGGNAEIDVDAIRQALEALHDGLESERQRLAQQAERTQAGKGSFELDRQHLDELMESLRHEQEQQEQRRMQRKPAPPADEFVLSECPGPKDSSEQRAFQMQDTAVMGDVDAPRTAEEATQADIDAPSVGEPARCESPEFLVDIPDDDTDADLLAAAESPHEQVRAEMESLRVVANASARRAIRRHTWTQRLSIYGLTLALCSASAAVMLWSWGMLTAGAASSLAWGAGAVGLIASLGIGFDARQKNRHRKSSARRA